MSCSTGPYGHCGSCHMVILGPAGLGTMCLAGSNTGGFSPSPKEKLKMLFFTLAQYLRWHKNLTASFLPLNAVLRARSKMSMSEQRQSIPTLQCCTGALSRGCVFESTRRKLAFQVETTRRFESLLEKVQRGPAADLHLGGCLSPPFQTGVSLG